MKIDNFKIEDWFNQYEKLSKYDMADTCVESLSIEGLFEIVGEREKHLDYIFSKKLNYGEIQGSERLKFAISKMYKGVNPKSITVTHGAIGANQLVMLALVEPNDEVVVVLPTYQQHYSIPKSFGARVKRVFLKEENNWVIDLEDLKSAVSENTKLICINNPNNPTGAVMPIDVLKGVVDIAKRVGSYILSDEVYRGLEHNGCVSSSIVELYERGISTGSMSKVFSLAGLRVGWIVAPDDVLENIVVQREYNTISISALDDYFSMIALENKEKIIERNLSIILEGKKILSDWVDGNSFISWKVPEGGTTALLKYDLDMSSVDLCKSLLKDRKVLFLPASTLEMEGYLRVGYCSDIRTLKDGLTIFSEWLNNQKC